MTSGHPLILSLFPGIGLLDLAFEQEWPEACIVRGPDLIFNRLSDIRDFHPPAGVFWGLIGWPPCQEHSQLKFLNPLAGKHGNLIPEFERVVGEAHPVWFLMENVVQAPVPQISGYWAARNVVLNNRWLGEAQQRVRRFSFGVRCDVSPGGIALDVTPDLVLFESGEWAPTVLAGHGPVGRGRGYTSNLTIEQMCRLQGVQSDFLSEAPFTAHGKRQVLGNAVPLPLGRAIARAVRRAMSDGGDV